MIDWIRESLHRFRAFFRKPQLDRELDAEMAAHLELAIAENLQRGMSPEEARRQALIGFGGTEQAKEHHRETRSLPLLEILSQDLRYTIRTLRRDRAFAAIAVLILALGIGANIAVFSVVNTILLRPLPFPNAARLAWLAGNSGVGGLSTVTYRVDAYEEFQRHNQSFQEVTAFVPFLGYSDYKLTGHGEPKPVSGVLVAGDFFQTLGVQPELGRLFIPEECRKGAAPAVLLTHAFWREEFSANPSIVGQAITLNNRSVTVVGVLPATFDFGSVFSPGSKYDVFAPIAMDEIRNFGHMLSLVGLLKPGITVSQAQAEATVLFPQLKGSDNPSWVTDIRMTITGLQDYVSGKLRRSLIVLWCAVGLILLIVCVNLSNLLLSRTAARSKEFAVRNALGASRVRLFRQLLTESLVLSGAGAAVGAALAFALTTYLAHQGSIGLPLLSSIRVDGAALAWTLLITLVVAFLFGLAPGLILGRGNVQEALKESGRGTSEGKKHDQMRSMLVVSEVALACVLLVSAGLLLRSFLHVLDVDLGFQPSQAYSIQVDYDDGGNAAKRGAILQVILRRVSAIPGIEAAGFTDMLPLSRNRSWDLLAKGSVHPKEENLDAMVRIVTPGYLQAMGIRLREGRDFTWLDTPKSEPVIVINETAARRHWPGESPIGHIAQGIGDGDTKVVGVISDIRQNSLEEGTIPEVFVPITQGNPQGAELVVRSKLLPTTLAPGVMSALRELNPGQPIVELRPIQTLVDHAVSPRRFFVMLVSIFAGLGLMLAALGIYGVISYSVARQTREIGIRMALGATAGHVLLGVLSKTMRLATLGIGLGAIASFAVARWISSLLFHTEPADPATFLMIILLLIVVAYMSGFFPARRACGIDPMAALRND
jgi:predicted permease